VGQGEERFVVLVEQVHDNAVLGVAHG
jgi:hypothetical protein